MEHNEQFLIVGRKKIEEAPDKYKRIPWVFGVFTDHSEANRVLIDLKLNDNNPESGYKMTNLIYKD